jgi:2-methylisocitrate lyase-like PEP mutase family enzyme
MSLAALLKGPGLLTAPGVYDALTALIAEQAGARAVYLSGRRYRLYPLRPPRYRPRLDGEVADTIAAIRDRVALPLIVDADTGFGNALNTQRTMRAFERAGADAIQLEDQTLPKRCGHLDGKTLIPAGEMVGKIRAALDVRDRTLVIARTDAIAVEGFDAALDRAEMYTEAGADVLFIEAPQSRDHLEAITARFGGPHSADGQHGRGRQDAHRRY